MFSRVFFFSHPQISVRRWMLHFSPCKAISKWSRKQLKCTAEELRATVLFPVVIWWYSGWPFIVWEGLPGCYRSCSHPVLCRFDLNYGWNLSYRVEQWRQYAILDIRYYGKLYISTYVCLLTWLWGHPFIRSWIKGPFLCLTLNHWIICRMFTKPGKHLIWWLLLYCIILVRVNLTSHSALLLLSRYIEEKTIS